MKVVCAYLLACLGGNSTPSADDLKNILGSVGIEGDEGRLQLFMDQIAGKSIEEVIASGRGKLASVPSGGGGGGVAVSAAPSSGGGAAAEPAKEEKVEAKEESDDDMGFSLFD
ncbi:large ribosomal subunit protein P2A-like [Silene latifolia]|uniref:large ribosomal subunit protein P2A-like n=1 Tax=Silene latifolia TaxID=37657 RepID=UPI003D7769E3